MKLISWNCQGAFRKKAGVILKNKPDILIVQECESPDKLLFSAKTQQPSHSFWYGDSIHKGVGAFSYTDFTFELLPVFNPAFRYILPIRVTGKDQTFTLLAIWAMDHEKKEERYIGQIWRAIHHYTELLEGPVILTGDFNSNKIWDYKGRVGSHSAVVEKLAAKNIYSVYHKYFNQQQGEEAHPTFFLYRNKKKPYHLDYCFASANFYNKIRNVEIGSHRKWRLHSDHTPLIVEFDL